MPSQATRAAIARYRLREVDDRDTRAASYTEPTQVLEASAGSSDALISVLAHSRIYSNRETTLVSSGVVTGLAFDTPHAVYYDDATLSSTAPTVLASTDIATGQVGAAPGRHPLGVITTPVSTGTAVTGGGAYPPASAVGGELP